jgi:RNA polymerase sigma-70 factor, ECF subfamily
MMQQRLMSGATPIEARLARFAAKKFLCRALRFAPSGACNLEDARFGIPRRGACLDLERFRSYLLLLARMWLDRKAQAKLDASDAVQQTMLEAHQATASFRGENVAAQAAWLRQILARNLANAVRDLTRQKRDVSRERSIHAGLDASASHLEAWLAANQSSASQAAQRHERALRVAQALAALPENQREAVVLRHFHGYSLAEIAEELGTTTAAVTGLLHRGLKNLRQQLKELE